MNRIKTFLISLWSEPVTNRERVFTIGATVILISLISLLF